MNCSCTLCADRAESSPSPVLENIIQALQRDDFDLQHEAALALEQACLSADCKRMLLTVPQYAAQLVTLGMVFEHLLRAPGSGEAPISVVRVIGALTAAAGEIGHSSQAELVNLWVEVGITEALDDVQVRPLLCRSGRWILLLMCVRYVACSIRRAVQRRGETGAALEKSPPRWSLNCTLFLTVRIWNTTTATGQRLRWDSSIRSLVGAERRWRWDSTLLLPP
jgi:hypothetical protein